MDWLDKNIGNLFVLSVFLLGLILAGLGVYSLVRNTFSSGKVEYCYIETETPHGFPTFYILRGFRDWRPDSRMGVFATLDQAKTAADTMQCPLATQK